jgi:hypothetical protein
MTTNLEELKRAAEARLSGFASSAANGIDILGEIIEAYGSADGHPQWQRLIVRQVAEDVTSLLAENDRLRSELEAERERRESAEEDKARLDFLDQCNRNLNEYCGTVYRWRMVMSHNVNRLFLRDLKTVDLHDSEPHGLSSCRDAIDAEMRRVEAARAHFQSQEASDGE